MKRRLVSYSFFHRGSSSVTIASQIMDVEWPFKTEPIIERIAAKHGGWDEGHYGFCIIALSDVE